MAEENQTRKEAFLQWLSSVLILVIGTGLSLFCLFFVSSIYPFAFAVNFHPGQLTLAFIIVIIALQFALLSPRLRPYWLEVNLVALILFGSAVFFATPVTTSLLPGVHAPLPCNTSTSTSGSFLLPAKQIKTDLKAFQSKDSWNNLSLLLVVSDGVHPYNATICSTAGVGNDTPNPPYTNDLVKVVVKLTVESQATDFAKDLESTSAIYILPHQITPIPAPTTISPTFALPFNKLQLSNACLKAGKNFEVIVVTSDHKAYSYPVTLNVTPDTCLSNQSDGKTTSVTVTLNNVTNDVATAFSGQLSNPTAIYLIQNQPA